MATHLVDRLLVDYPMAKVTSLEVGGPADYFFRPTSPQEIQWALKLANEKRLPVTVIGYGTNLLVTDKGIRGLVIQIADSYAQAKVEGNFLTATAGCLYGSISKLAAYHGLAGLEFAVGIPGGVGGAVFMNAGAYDGEIGPLVRRVKWVSDQSIDTWDKGEYSYSYRCSRVQQAGVVVAEVTLELTPGDRQAIYGKMDDFQQRRRSRQPLEYPSAGSTFKRPEGHFVGPMIEEAKLKGYRVGGAQVSEKHAGFIINRGGATAQDILDLIDHIQKTIKHKFGVDLEPEVRIIGQR